MREEITITALIAYTVVLFFVSRLLDKVRNRNTPKIETCTRGDLHVCGVNGPCNGWPNKAERTLLVSRRESCGCTSKRYSDGTMELTHYHNEKGESTWGMKKL